MHLISNGMCRENVQDGGKEGAVAKRGCERTGAEHWPYQSSRFSPTRSLTHRAKGQDKGQGAPTANTGQSNGGVIGLLWFAVLTTFSFIKAVYVMIHISRKWIENGYRIIPYVSCFVIVSLFCIHLLFRCSFDELLFLVSFSIFYLPISCGWFFKNYIVCVVSFSILLFNSQSMCKILSKWVDFRVPWWGKNCGKKYF